MIANQADQCINILSSPQLPDSDQLLKEMVVWCQRWDKVYGHDARELYPEFSEILDRYEYSIPGKFWVHPKKK
jgi:hypothetical protein